MARRAFKAVQVDALRCKEARIGSAAANPARLLIPRCLSKNVHNLSPGLLYAFRLHYCFSRSGPTSEIVNTLAITMNPDHTISERLALERYCGIVEDKLGWGSSDRWRDQDFETLSQRIFEASNVSLSVTTLKRIFGRLKYDGLPNASTLNALATYLGFGSWLEFTAQKQAHPQTQLQSQAQSQGQERGRIVLKRWPLMYVLLFVALAGIVLSFVLKRNGNVVPAKADAIVFASEPVAKGIPNTVIFRFDIGDLTPQRMEIQQSWDTTKRFVVSPEMTTASSTYYYPGYFRAKLLVDGQIVKEHDLLIPSGGWLATLNEEPRPRYFLKHELINMEVLGVQDHVMETLPVHPDGPGEVVFHYVDNFDHLSLDDFSLEATIKNTYAKGNGVCRMTRVILLGTEGYVIIPVSIPGCTGDLRLVVNDVVHEGKSRDLSSLGWDFSYWLKFKCTIDERRLRIYFNNRLIYGVEYTGGLGDFAGMRFAFTGSGLVDDVRMRDGAGNIVFTDSF